MINKIISYIKTNDFKQDLLYASFAITLFIAIFSTLFLIILNDINKDQAELNLQLISERDSLQEQLRVCSSKYDSIIQSYEEVVPKQQYIDDIEYLESVILQLREQIQAQE